MTLTVDGNEHASAPGVCDTTPVVDTGWFWTAQARITEGSDFLFFAEFLIPPGEVSDTPSIERFASGDNDPIENPTVLATVPPAPPWSGVAPDVSLTEPQAGFVAGGPLSGDPWEGEVFGVVEVESLLDDGTQCFVIVGTITPTNVPGGGEAEPLSMPEASLVVEGRATGGPSGCAQSVEFEDLGYGELAKAFVSEGTAYPFYNDIVVSGPGPYQLQAIIIGDINSAEATFIEPLPLAVIPSP